MLLEFLVAGKLHREEICHAAHVRLGQDLTNGPALRYQLQHLGFELRYLFVGVRRRPYSILLLDSCLLSHSALCAQLRALVNHLHGKAKRRASPVR
jgi:hypothetical protein